MLFVELRYLAFLAVVVAVHWSLPKQGWRKVWLLVTSYAFYAAWDWRFLSLIWLSTIGDYTFGALLARSKGRRKVWVACSVVLNLAVLGTFKYYDFFAASAARALGLVGITLHPTLLAVILPAGISFYTFESISYTVNIYRGEPPARSLLDFALFLSFFPHLVAGPILRPSELLPQLQRLRRFAEVDARAALVLFLRGFVKKACIADALAILADRYFDHPASHSATAAWLAVLSYAIQLYCDFSGYTDMARASAQLLGYELVENFEFPYFASSFSEFWQRWHITLSRWLRDYVYIPLGGGRSGHRNRNVLITMALCGLWHGAGWNFVLWGAMHGVFLVIERPLRRVAWPRGAATRSFVGNVLTFYWFCVSLAVFRMTSFGALRTMLGQLILLRSPGELRLPTALVAFLFACAFIHKARERRLVGDWWRRLAPAAFAFAFGAALGVALSLMQIDYRPFIYFQF